MPTRAQTTTTKPSATAAHHENLPAGANPPRATALAGSAGNAPTDTPVGRAEDTRARLIAAAIALFAHHGYDGVTTRMLCQRAGTNQAAIPYHFGGKEGMYLAAAAAVCDHFGPPLEAALARASAGLAAGGREAAARALEALLPELAEAAFAEAERTDLFTFFVREELSASPAFELFHVRLLAPLYAVTGELLTRVQGAPAAPELVHAFVGQLGSFVSGRQAMLRQFGHEGDYRPEDVARIRAALAQAARLWVRGLAAAR